MVLKEGHTDSERGDTLTLDVFGGRDRGGSTTRDSPRVSGTFSVTIPSRVVRTLFTNMWWVDYRGSDRTTETRGVVNPVGGRESGKSSLPVGCPLPSVVQSLSGDSIFVTNRKESVREKNLVRPPTM